MSAGYTVITAGAIALVAATAKSILGLENAANAHILLVEFHISFDGVTADAVPVLVELCSSTQAGAGTSTPQAAQQIRGAPRTVTTNGERNYTAEPTVLTVLKEWLVPAFMGSLTIQHPLGREVEQTVTQDALIVRCTAPAAVNTRGYLEFEE